jgi:hypothetical protein
MQQKRSWSRRGASGGSVQPAPGEPIGCMAPILAAYATTSAAAPLHDILVGSWPGMSRRVRAAVYCNSASRATQQRERAHRRTGCSVAFSFRDALVLTCSVVYALARPVINARIPYCKSFPFPFTNGDFSEFI